MKVNVLHTSSNLTLLSVGPYDLLPLSGLYDNWDNTMATPCDVGSPYSLCSGQSKVSLEARSLLADLLYTLSNFQMVFKLLALNSELICVALPVSNLKHITHTSDVKPANDFG